MDSFPGMETLQNMMQHIVSRHCAQILILLRLADQSPNSSVSFPFCREIIMVSTLDGGWCLEELALLLRTSSSRSMVSSVCQGSYYLNRPGPSNSRLAAGEGLALCQCFSNVSVPGITWRSDQLIRVGLQSAAPMYFHMMWALQVQSLHFSQHWLWS